MATIRDIARVSGFGIGTVSRVLNGGANVRPETAEAVLVAARQLCYVPGRSARRLVRGTWSNTTIGIALPSVIHPFWMEIVRGVYRALEKTRYHILLYNLGQQPSDVYLHILAEEPAGLLIVGDAVPRSILARMRQEGLPVLYLDREDPEAPCLCNDNRAGGRMAAAYLLERGVRTPAYIGEEFQSQQQQDRFGAFRERLAEAGIREIDRYHIRPLEEESARLTASLLDRNRVDGIFYFSDSLAYGGVAAMRRAGRTLPCIGYDDQLPSRYLGISSIRQPGYELGAAGARALLAHITRGAALESRRFSPELKERTPEG